MKAIISHGYYFNYGKQYQVKFIYENELEAKKLSSYIESIKDDNEINPYNGKYINEETNSPIEAIRGTNIKKDKLLPFINTLINNFNARVIIREQEFTNFNLEEINEAIDKLHINAIIYKGNYFDIDDTYYVTFNYATEEQKREINYDFNYRFKSIIGGEYKPGIYKLFPFYIDEHSNITIKNTRTIGGTNIPTELLPFLIKIFIENYNMIITIDDSISNSKENSSNIIKSLTTIKTGKIKTRKRQGSYHTYQK